MNKLVKLISFIALLSQLSCTGDHRYSHITIGLNNNWQFTSALYQKGYPANIPGSIHTDLYRNGLIPDPFTGNNEMGLQWIDTLDWIYYKKFKKPLNLENNSQMELVFKGIDTYADVYLNDSLLFSSNNMFVEMRSNIPVNGLKEYNNLKVLIKSPTKESQTKYHKLPYELPGGPRVFTRKAAYHYGWDWAPNYATCGIWQDVELHIWNTARIRDLNYEILKLDSSAAIVRFQAQIESKNEFTGKIKLTCKNQNLAFTLKDIKIKEGTHNYDFELEIKNPKLWWVSNMGKPFLYDFEARLSTGNKIFDTKNMTIGLRTIELIREPEQKGESFYFKLNGVPVFMKGANYVPQSSFPGTVTEEQYKKIIGDASAANMNMLRVWGGGIYEKDIFYDLCDEAGILLWQDFMFANAMYPADSAFIENIKSEASFQVNRLRKHPSIAVWCGNNEIDEAWHNWGWAKSYSKADSAEIWDKYKNIFHSILPDIVKSYCPEIPYTSSSPMFGRGNPRSSSEGDNHYWYVWHDSYDFDWYNKVTGRFMSEFGFQSYPDMETIELFDTSQIKNNTSEIIAAHQKHQKGNMLIKQYMEGYYPVPEKFTDFIYVSQILQAEGIRTGILAQRRAKPFCMGSLYWQLNDCWPAISWSGISYSGNWKALHYFAKKDFRNIIISPYINNDSLEIHIVSDSLSILKLDLKFTLMDFDGKIKSSESTGLDIPANSSKNVFIKSIAAILGKNKPECNLVLLELFHNHKIIERRIVYFSKPKDLELKECNIKIACSPANNGYEIIIHSNTLVKNLCIQIPAKGHFSENFFDLLPGIEKKVFFYTEEKIEDIESQLEFKSLNKIIPNHKQAK